MKCRKEEQSEFSMQIVRWVILFVIFRVRGLTNSNKKVGEISK